MKKIYALLVGIDSYLGGVRNLSGCVNDVKAVEELLPALLGDDAEFVPDTLLNGDATRDNIIAKFRSHLGKAGAGDVALFWYSGHGSQQPSALPFEPDGLDETLVCADSRLPGKSDLADKELNVLVREAGRNGAEVLVVLDCCHSGSGVRALDEGGVAVRRIEMDTRMPQGYLNGVQARTTRHTSGWEDADEANYVLLAACRSDETAKEVKVGRVTRGAFSAAMEQALVLASGRFGYADLVEWTRARLSGLVAQQNPQLECTDPAKAHHAFLGGSLRGEPGFLMVHDQSGWYVNVGSVHGITREVQFAVCDGAQTVAQAKPSAVEPARTPVTVTAQLDTTRPYRVIVARWSAARIAVSVEGDADDLRTALADVGFVQIVDDDVADVRVVAEGAGYRISRPRRGLKLVHEAGDTGAAVHALERMAAWQVLRDLANPASGIATSDLQVELLHSDGIRLPDNRVVYATDDTPPKIKIRVRNNSDRRLFVSILSLNEEHAIGSLTAPAAGEWLAPGAAFFAGGGKALKVSIPDHLAADGVTEVTDVIKVVACTEQFDARTYLHPALSTTVDKAPIRAPGALQMMNTRTISVDDDDADWQAVTFPLVVERPRPGTRLVGRTTLDGGVVVTAPAAFRGSARLGSLPTASRDLPVDPVPAVLQGSEPFDLASTRGKHDLSMLELDFDTPATPLRINVPVPPAENERVLPYAWDGQHHVPVGRFDRDTGELEITVLPEPVASERGLWKSVRILFRKIVLSAIGIDSGYPRLAVASVDDGRITFTPATQKAVHGARRVLLVLHGIIGETDGIIRYAHDAKLPHDLVLAFDYESIGTRIETTAEELAAKLKALSLECERIDVLAHSMGGLVTRYMLEHVDNPPTVTKVVLAGTPHQGSPWPRVQDWASTMIALGLNVAPPGFTSTIIGALVGVIEKVDDGLDQMRSDSKLIEQLATGPGPRISYDLLTGTRSISLAQADGLFSKLQLLKMIDAKVLKMFGGPNDIAVSVTSSGGVPDLPVAPRRRPVDCNHMSYFVSPVSIEVLNELLR